jgi:predicted dehydrogenase
MHAPQLDTREALAVEVENVIEAIHGEAPLMADGRAGWRVVRILEAAQRSIEQGGVLVPLATPVGGAGGPKAR